MGFLGGITGKELSCQCKGCKWRAFYPWVGKVPWRREWLPAPVFLPGEFHEQEPGKLQSIHCKELDTADATEQADTMNGLRVCVLSQVWLFVTPWTVAHQASLSMEFYKQEYWSGLSFPTSQPKNRTRIYCVSCPGRWMFYLCTTWEAHEWMDWRKQ